MKSFVAMLLVSLTVAHAQAAIFTIDAANPNNGITDIYSTTFDEAPASGMGNDDPFFGVELPLPPGRAIQLSTNPSGVVANTVPAGFTSPPFGFPPAAGSFLDLSLSAGNTMLTFAGGTVAMPSLDLLIMEGTPSETTIFATNPGIVLNPTPVTVSLDSNGVAVFEVDPPSVGVAADFSTFSQVVGLGDCTGPLCAIVPALSLDMLKFRLIVDFDPTFSSFTADFIGQTSGFSMVFATLDSTVVPIPAAVWLFGSGLLGLIGLSRRRKALVPVDNLL